MASNLDGDLRNIIKPGRPGDRYWPRSKTLFVKVVGKYDIDEKDAHDFMRDTFGPIKIFCKNEKVLRIKDSDKYSHMYFCRFRQEISAPEFNEGEQIFINELLGNLNVDRAPYNAEFECIDQNNDENYQRGRDYRGRNIGPPRVRGSWPGDRNMYLGIKSSTEPDIRELYDMMLEYGKIVRFIKDEKVKGTEECIWRGYWCCFRYSKSAKAAFGKLNEWKIHGSRPGNSLWEDLEISYPRDYKR